MARVRISLAPADDQVRIELQEFEGPLPAALRQGLFQLDAETQPDGYTIGVAAFRRNAVEFARLLRTVDAEITLDPRVEELLRTQLADIRARPRMPVDLEIRDKAEVLDLVLASGRLRERPNDQQLENLTRLLALRHGANFSVPGAGKTLTLLSLYEALRRQKVVDRLLVVAPKNAFISWEEEIERCYFPDSAPSTTRLAGGLEGVGAALDGDPEVALITYQMLANAKELLLPWCGRHDTHVVLDESHRIKQGYGAVSATAALELGDSAVRRDILSGTPLPQAPEDLRAQLEFLWPGQRILPEANLGPSTSTEQQKSVAQSIAPLYVRTTKAQLELPRLLVTPEPIELGPIQRELYELLRSQAARAAYGLRTRDQRLFRLLGRHVMRLLQAAVDPILLVQGQMEDPEPVEAITEGSRAWSLLRELAAHERPAKIEAAVRRAEEIVGSGRKVLIWTQFIRNVTHLEQRLEGLGAVVLYGAVPTGDSNDPETREGRIRLFHEDEGTTVMIANPAAAGEGISLHRACHDAVYLDRSFNAAHYLQSVDRIHRLGLGSETETRVEILEAAGTIDRRVGERLNAKVEAMRLILNDQGLAALAYDPEDVQERFPGGIEASDVDPILEHLEEAGS